MEQDFQPLPLFSDVADFDNQKFLRFGEPTVEELSSLDKGEHNVMAIGMLHIHPVNKDPVMQVWFYGYDEPEVVCAGSHFTADYLWKQHSTDTIDKLYSKIWEQKHNFGEQLHSDTLKVFGDFYKHPVSVYCTLPALSLSRPLSCVPRHRVSP